MVVPGTKGWGPLAESEPQRTCSAVAETGMRCRCRCYWRYCREGGREIPCLFFVFCFSILTCASHWGEPTRQLRRGLQAVGCPFNIQRSRIRERNKSEGNQAQECGIQAWGTQHWSIIMVPIARTMSTGWSGPMFLSIAW